MFATYRWHKSRASNKISWRDVCEGDFVPETARFKKVWGKIPVKNRAGSWTWWGLSFKQMLSTSCVKAAPSFSLRMQLEVSPGAVPTRTGVSPCHGSALVTAGLWVCYSQINRAWRVKGKTPSPARFTFCQGKTPSPARGFVFVLKERELGSAKTPGLLQRQRETRIKSLSR